MGEIAGVVTGVDFPIASAAFALIRLGVQPFFELGLVWIDKNTILLIQVEIRVEVVTLHRVQQLCRCRPRR